MVCLELLKVVQDKPLEAYRNSFANLAVPVFAMAEPILPKRFTFGDLSWTLWDRWVLEGDLTVQQVLDWFVVSFHSAQGQVTLALAPVLASNRPSISTPSAAALDGVSESQHAGRLLQGRWTCITCCPAALRGTAALAGPCVACSHPFRPSHTCRCSYSCGTLLRMCLR